MQKFPSFGRGARGFFALALLAFAPVCKKTVTPPKIEGLALIPAERNRDSLIVSASARSIEGSIARSAEIAALLGLPTTAADIRTLLIARSQLPEAAVSALDLSRPIGAAFVAQATTTNNDPTKNDPMVAVAVAAKSATDATRFITAMGSERERKDNAIQVGDPAQGQRPLWILARGEVLIIADSLDALVAAGEHALAAREAAREDLTVTLYPEVLARSQGKDLSSAVAELRAKAGEAAAAQAAAEGRNPDSGRALMDRMMAFHFDWIVELRAVDLALVIDEKDGLRLFSRLHAKAGSALEKRFLPGPAAALDPALLGPGPPLMLGAFAYSQEFFDSYLKALLPRVAPTPEARPVFEAMRTLTTLTVPEGSMRWDLENKRSVFSFTWRLKDSTSDTALWAALDGLLAPKTFGAFLKAQSPEMKLKTTWQHNNNEGRFGFEYSNTKDPRTREFMKVMTALFGSPKFELVIRMARGRALVTTEPGASARLGKLAAITSAEPSPDLRAILDETRAFEGWIALDLLAMIRTAIGVAAATEPGAGQLASILGLIPGLDRQRVPFIFGYKGGPYLYAELHIPRHAFESVGALLGPLRAIGLGPPGLGGPAQGGVLTPNQ